MLLLPTVSICINCCFTVVLYSLATFNIQYLSHAILVMQFIICVDDAGALLSTGQQNGTVFRVFLLQGQPTWVKPPSNTTAGMLVLLH